MKIRYITACVSAAIAMGSLPSAYGAPFNGTQVTQYRSTSDFASGFNCSIANVCTVFSAQAYDDSNGVAQGFVYVQFFDLSTFQFQYIYCYGPNYATSTSVNPGSGKAVISATLDPSAPDCFNFNVGAPVAVNLSGQANGSYSNSQSGVSVQQFSGVKYQSNFKANYYSETFNGTIGAVSGPFDGSVSTYRSTNLQQVK
jgi:hypothetical protein